MATIYNTKIFTEIYEDYAAFSADKTTYFPLKISNTSQKDNLEIVYYLLYAKYGNSPIANLDENQFKAKLWATIWQYGPAWEKRVDIQDELKALTSTDLLQGAKVVHNHAFNPSTEPSTATLEELTYINDQNTSNYKKSKMDAYGQLWSLITSDVTEEFMLKFKKLFQSAVNLNPFLYESEN